MARVPIIVMTADRPPELHGVGANQTIDQQHLFGSFVKWFCDTGVPEMAPRERHRWASLGQSAIQHAVAVSPTRACAPEPAVSRTAAAQRQQYRTRQPIEYTTYTTTQARPIACPRSCAR